MLVFFFFSSRRRHTRCSRDWSSDVCSSDLRRHAASADRARERGRGRGEERRRDGGFRPWGKRPSRHGARDRKSTRLNSNHGYISYAVFCLKKKKKRQKTSNR